MSTDDAEEYREWLDAPLTMEELEFLLTLEDSLLQPRGTLHKAVEVVYNWLLWLDDERPPTLEESLDVLGLHPDVDSDCTEAVQILRNVGKKDARLLVLVRDVSGRVPDTDLPETALPIHQEESDLEVPMQLPPWAHAWMRLASDEAGMSQEEFTSAIIPFYLMEHMELHKETERAIKRADRFTRQASESSSFERAERLFKRSKKELDKAGVHLVKDSSRIHAMGRVGRALRHAHAQEVFIAWVEGMKWPDED